jgi:TolB protein
VAAKSAPILYTVEWGPDGDAFIDIHTIRADGTHARNLMHNTTQTAGYPVWTPDAKRVLYGWATTSGPTNRIFEMNADGSAPHELTNGARSDDEPTVSHDGRWIAFSEQTPAHGTVIVLMHPNGSGRHTLGPPPGPPDGGDRTPSFSPNGTQLALSRNGEIDILDVATGTIRRLPATNASCVSPHWSPDGKSVIALCGEKTAKVVNLTDGTAHDLADAVAADWSPDGSQLVLAQLDTVAHDFSLSTANADGSNPTEIWHTPPNKNIFIGTVAWGSDSH